VDAKKIQLNNRKNNKEIDFTNINDILISKSMMDTKKF